VLTNVFAAAEASLPPDTQEWAAAGPPSEGWMERVSMLMVSNMDMEVMTMDMEDDTEVEEILEMRYTTKAVIYDLYKCASA
jgi:hypothetical protein